MTVAIGIKYPWGELNRLIPPDIEVSESIILASDSRFSRKLSTGFVPSSDSGTKLFQLGNDCAAVYAGDCSIAEKCLDELRHNLPNGNSYVSTPSQIIAQKIFKDVFQHQIAVRKLDADDAPTYIIIGACNKNRRAELYIFRYNTGFTPETINNPEAIGFEETVSAFKGMFEPEIHKRVGEELTLRDKYPQIPMASMNPLPIKDAHIAMLVTGMLNKIIESGSDSTIGGDIQCAILNATGVSFPKIAYTTDLRNEGPGWIRVTAKRDELITVTGISGVFGSYSFMD